MFKNPNFSGEEDEERSLGEEKLRKPEMKSGPRKKMECPSPGAEMPEG